MVYLRRAVLDRIEATLERVSRQLDNQVVVNAELRQTSTQLQQSVGQLQETVGQLQETVGQLTSSVGSLIGITNQHQENFMVLVTEIRDIRAETQNIRVDMLQMQSEIREIQTDNRRILGLIQGLENEG